MGLRVINAYINGELTYVKLSKEIRMLEAEAIIVDIEKLKKALVKAQASYPETIGVTLANNVLIRYMPANEKNQLKFEGMVWSTRSKLTGRYEVQ